MLCRSLQLVVRYAWLASWVLACSSGNKGGGGSSGDPLVNQARIGTVTPFTPREQSSTTALCGPGSETSVSVYTSRITCADGTLDAASLMSLKLIPSALTQTPSLLLMSPLMLFSVQNDDGTDVDRTKVRKSFKAEVIVDRYIEEKETVVLMIINYGTAAETRYMVVPEDVTFTLQEDNTRLISFEARDTNFAFAVAAAKHGDPTNGYARYPVVPADSTSLTGSSADVVDQAGDVRLTWVPAEGARTGYLLKYAYEDFSSLGCQEGEAIDHADIAEFRQKFPKSFTDSFTATGLDDDNIVYFQLCSTNSRTPPDVSPGLGLRFVLPRRALVVLTGTPADPSNATSLDVTVGGGGISEYQYALLDGGTPCAGANYSAWSAIQTKITGTLAEGQHRLCVLGKKNAANIQVVATEYAWTTDLTAPGALTIDAMVTPTNDATPNIAWQPSTGASSYTVKIATDNLCSTVVQTKNETVTTTTASALNPGTYYVCVTAKDAAGNATVASNAGAISFEVDTVPPTFTSLLAANAAADGYVNAAEAGSVAAFATLIAGGYTAAAFTNILDNTPAVTCNSGRTYSNTVVPAINSMPALDDSYVVCVRLTDAAGNVTYGKSSAVVRDVSVPAATNIIASVSNGTYTTGSTISMTVTLNQVATRSGSVGDVRLGLETGLTDRYAIYTGGSGTTTLTFDYVVQAGDTNSDLDILALAPQLSYTGDRSFSDAAGNALNVDFSAATSLASNSNIIIDTTPPGTFSITAPTAASTVNAQTYTITWSDPGDASTYNLLIDDTSGCSSPTQTFSALTVPAQVAAFPDGVWYICVTALDGVGNQGAASNNNLSFTIATGSWSAVATAGAPSVRHHASSVWDSVRNRMIVWGGVNGVTHYNTGGEYDPGAGNAWSATDVADMELPVAREQHTAIWTGTTMIVWGGYNTADAYLDQGGIYLPSGPDHWVETTTTNAPAARRQHSAIWTGTNMIVWGGENGAVLADGGVYTPPGAEGWAPTQTSGAPSGRKDHTAVWTGTEMIVWGGYDGVTALNTGGRYDPAAAGTWTAVTTIGAPSARYGHVALWTGTHMLIWGGYNGVAYNNTGGIFDPSGGGSWLTMSTTDALSARQDVGAVWDDFRGQMLLFGGSNGAALSSGAAFDPLLNRWTIPAMNSSGKPAARLAPLTVWTGTTMVLWGGSSGATDLLSGGRFVPP